MFKELSYISGNSYSNDGFYDEECFNIIDDDFEQYVCCSKDFATKGFVIMDAYKKRNLNVVKNFILYIQGLSNDGCNIKHIIKINEEENVLYSEYKEEIEKYLLLL